MSRAALTILLLVGSNVFMTVAWYWHVKKDNLPLWGFILISWLIALPEYCLAVPANRLGSAALGGPFSIAQLKIMQEAIGLTVFMAFSLTVLNERLRWQDLAALGLVFAAVVLTRSGR
jgi:uncharacterized protein (DUF486 family)